MSEKVVLLRHFNNFINSKNGFPLPLHKRRTGENYWLQFENKLVSILRSLDLNVKLQIENDQIEDFISKAFLSIYCHKNIQDLKIVNSNKNLFYMQMHQKSLFTLNNSGWGVSSSEKFIPDIELDKKKVESFYENFILPKIKNKETKITIARNLYEIEKFESTSLPDSYIFVPLQVSKDYVIKNYSNYSVFEFLINVIEVSRKHKKHIIVKPHPLDYKSLEFIKILNENKENPYFHLCNSHVYDLIEKAQSVFLINSGVGFESLFFLKPVVNFGRSDYDCVTIKGDFNHILDVFSEVDSFDDNQIHQYKKFLYWYFNEYAFDLQLNIDQRLKQKIIDTI